MPFFVSLLIDLNGTNLHDLRDYALALLRVAEITQMVLSLIHLLLLQRLFFLLVQLSYLDDDRLPLPCDDRSYHR